MPVAIQISMFFSLTQNHTGLIILNVNDLLEIIPSVIEFCAKVVMKLMTLWRLERLIKKVSYCMLMRSLPRRNSEEAYFEFKDLIC